MAPQRRRRGISIGTVVMLAVTCLVIGGMAAVLPKLSSTEVVIDTGKVLQALSLGDHMPHLGLSDIPISVINRTQTTAAPDPLREENTLPPAQEQTHQPTYTPQPTAAPTQTPIPGGRFTATFGGSVIIGTELRQAHYYSESKKYDFSDVLSLLRPELTADLSMVTLENIIYPDGKLSDTVTTDAVLPMLSYAGIDAVALGYRNAGDQGMEGLSGTIQAVQAQGMTALGAYPDADSARVERRMMELGGVKVALLHYSDALSDKGKRTVKEPNDFALAVDAVSDGVDRIASDVALARENGAQAVIVSLNWGYNSGKSTPTSKQKEFAQQLADAGVDVIIGSGSRIVQPVEWLTGNRDGAAHQTLCVYSLGSLFNGSRTNGNVASMLLHLELSYDGRQLHFEKVSYTPTYIWRFKQDGRYYYRVVASDQPAPDGMDDNQVESMERAMGTTRKYLGDKSPVELR